MEKQILKAKTEKPIVIKVISPKPEYISDIVGTLSNNYRVVLVSPKKANDKDSGCHVFVTIIWEAKNNGDTA